MVTLGITVAAALYFENRSYHRVSLLRRLICPRCLSIMLPNELCNIKPASVTKLRGVVQGQGSVWHITPCPVPLFGRHGFLKQWLPSSNPIRYDCTRSC
jgi:hypothetical protein